MAMIYFIMVHFENCCRIAVQYLGVGQVMDGGKYYFVVPARWLSHDLSSASNFDFNGGNTIYG